MALFWRHDLVWTTGFPHSQTAFLRSARDDPRLLANQSFPERKQEILGHDPADYPSSKWAGLKLPDLNRPAFMIAAVAELVRNRKCPTCKKDICPKDFAPWDALQRREYSISGMCPKCQGSVFCEAPVPAPKPTPVVNEYGSMTKPDTEGFAEWGQGLSMFSVGAKDSQEEKPSERFTRWDKSAEEVRAYREKRDAPAVVKGTIACQPHYGYGPRTRWFKCSLHGKKPMICIEDMDKYETWKCTVCGVCSTIRCRHYAGWGGDEI